MTADFRFSGADQQQILAAVKEAERLTSGEIRVFIDRECKRDVLDRAAFVFSELGMHKTEARNGVLIYLATKSRKFAILGDVGIHRIVGDDFWANIKSEMQKQFMLGDFVTGLRTGITLAGSALSQHFPYRSDDRNELSDEIVFGDQ